MPLKSMVMGYRTRWSPLQLSLVTIPEPIKPTQLVIKLAYIGLNPIDIKLKSISVLPMNYTVGKDFSGVVEVVGSALTNQFKPGERVCGGLLSPLQGFVGTLALIDVNKHAIMKVPGNMNDESAAAFPLTFGTAWGMLKRVPKLEPNCSVLVLGGATNVGSYAIQILKKHYNVARVVATCSENSVDYVKEMGADETIDYRAPNIESRLEESAAPEKFQAILDTVGGYSALSVWPEILNPYADGSAYVTIAGDKAPSGTYAHDMIGSLVSAPWIIGRILFGKRMGINYQVFSNRDSSWVKDSAQFLSEHEIKTPIDSITDLQRFEDAWDKLNHVGARGKVLIKCN